MARSVDHDAVFKLLLTAFFREFLELFLHDLAADLDPTPLTFLDKETFSNMIDPDRREADLVVQVHLRNEPATLLIHLEHQAQHDATLDRRLFRYFARFYDAFDLPVFPIALCSYASPRQHAADRHQVRVRDYTVLDFRYQVVQLNQLDWRDFLQTQNPVAMALMARMRIAPRDRWRVKAASLRLLAGAALTATQRQLLSQFIDLYLPLRVAEEQALQAEIATFSGPEQEAIVELVTSWEQKGRAEGLLEGQRLLVERQLTRKLGILPAPLRERVTSLNDTQLMALGEALLDFTTPADLEAWLQAARASQPGDHSATP